MTKPKIRAIRASGIAVAVAVVSVVIFAWGYWPRDHVRIERLSVLQRGEQGRMENVRLSSLPDSEAAIARVAERVRQGGHHIPEAVIRRRFAAGLRNFERAFKRAGMPGRNMITRARARFCLNGERTNQNDKNRKLCDIIKEIIDSL